MGAHNLGFPIDFDSRPYNSVMGCLHDPANVQQTSSKCNAGRLLDRVNTLLRITVIHC